MVDENRKMGAMEQNDDTREPRTEIVWDNHMPDGGRSPRLIEETYAGRYTVLGKSNGKSKILNTGYTLRVS